MENKFNLDFLNTIILLRDCQGNIIDVSRSVQDSFYHMSTIGEEIYYDDNNNTYWQKYSNIVIIDDSEFYQEEYINITKFVLENKKLSHDLKKDPLTKISNVNAVDDMKNELSLKHKNCVIVMCDVNDFKIINDSFGHDAGDIALIELSKLFESSIRIEQDLVARIGGDEFIFIFITDDIHSIMDKMSDIQTKVKELGETLGLPLSVSIGISNFNYGDDWETKKKETDSALYYVKNNTENKDQIAYLNYENKEFNLYKADKSQNKSKQLKKEF